MSEYFEDPYEDDSCVNCGEGFGPTVHESRIANLCEDCFQETQTRTMQVQNDSMIGSPTVTAKPPTAEQKAAADEARRLRESDPS